MDKFYITTSIPYVNAHPHIGFALEAVQADMLARWHRQLGDDVYFVTGTDENSLKNVQAAQKEGLETKALCDRNAEVFKSLKGYLNLSFDDFIRTTEGRHFKGAQKLWKACKSEDIYKKQYKGYYCVGCESFLLEKDLVDGKCLTHQKEPDIVEEENYFFKLSNYQDKLLKLIESEEYKIIPESRKNEIISFIKMGLEDFSISRSVERAHGWGVPVPDDDKQIMYVWIDALSNYINALDYLNDGQLYQKYWPADVHVIGKDITRFHAIYWPAILMSAGLALPKNLFVHGFINVGGQKMSKSLGNVIDPIELSTKYGTDTVRYFLLGHVHSFEDSDFDIERFEQIYNSDLVNGLGNLVNRVTNMIENYIDGDVKIDWSKVTPTPLANEEIRKFRFKEALQTIWLLIGNLNSLIENEKPWELAKSNDSKNKEALPGILKSLAKDMYSIANGLTPFMPKTAEKIIGIITADKIKKPEEPLFPRINNK
ncbi:methionine--tRNA ligase [Patescibacteria group bacterium]|nr:methionine--tRNA ligase [Patescibacteria group bacterium]